MAKTNNKYTTLNFNDIFEKKVINPTKQPPSSSLTNTNKPIISNSRIRGGILVLTRPSPKPISQPSPPPPKPISQPSPPPPSPSPSPAQPPVPVATRSEPDSISLRPLGRTGSGQSLSPSPLKLDKELPLSPKPNRFVPPHLRPGFVGREERLQGEVQKQPGGRPRELGGHRQGHFGLPNRYGEDSRPKSGGGYERMRRIGESDLGEMNRPGSREIRPSSSG